jgi:hypothetical protein
MTIIPLTPTSGDTEVTLTAKILLVLLGGGGSGGNGGSSSGVGAPSFTPTGVTFWIYQDTNTGILYVWNNVNGWYPTA